MQEKALIMKIRRETFRIFPHTIKIEKWKFSVRLVSTMLKANGIVTQLQNTLGPVSYTHLDVYKRQL